jgi:hypothetical protein
VADYRHFPSFEELCDRAEKSGLQVRLAVSAERVQSGLRRGEEYRPLERIELWPPMRLGHNPLAAAPILDGDLEAAALDLLARAA